MALEKAFVDPLEVGHAPEDRPDVALEDRVESGADAGPDQRRLDRVVDGDDAARDARCVVGRNAHEPCGIGLESPSSDPDRGMDRAVAGVVHPAGIVLEAVERRRAGRGMGRPRAGQHDQPAVGIGHHLAERDRHPLEPAAVERQRTGRGPFEVARRRGHDEGGPVGDVAVAPSRSRRALHVEGDVGLVPGRLGIGDGDMPRNVDVGRGQFGDHAVVCVIAEKTEPCRLLRDRAGRILERAGGQAARRFGAEEERVAAVADARHADCRVDRDPPDPVQHFRRERLCPCRRRSARKCRRQRRNELTPR